MTTSVVQRKQTKMDKITMILVNQPCSCPNGSMCSKSSRNEYKFDEIFIENETFLDNNGIFLNSLVHEIKKELKRQLKTESSPTPLL